MILRNKRLIFGKASSQRQLTGSS